MFLLKRPNPDEISRFIEQQAGRSLSYSAVGSSRCGEAPDGYVVDHHRIFLGQGNEVWRNAVEAIRRWQMFNLSWLQLAWPNAPISAGTTVAIIVEHFGFYSINASRIVYVIDETTPIRRFGFAYGTLEDHAESGEERFLIEWDPSDSGVYYDLFAFSRPNSKIVKYMRPLARKLQRRFAVDSVDAMRQFV